jgi:hypothetical protein
VGYAPCHIVADGEFIRRWDSDGHACRGQIPRDPDYPARHQYTPAYRIFDQHALCAIRYTHRDFHGFFYTQQYRFAYGDLYTDFDTYRDLYANKYALAYAYPYRANFLS